MRASADCSAPTSQARRVRPWDVWESEEARKARKNPTASRMRTGPMAAREGVRVYRLYSIVTTYILITAHKDRERRKSPDTGRGAESLPLQGILAYSYRLQLYPVRIFVVFAQSTNTYTYNIGVCTKTNVNNNKMKEEMTERDKTYWS